MIALADRQSLPQSGEVKPASGGGAESSLEEVKPALKPFRGWWGWIRSETVSKLFGGAIFLAAYYFAYRYGMAFSQVCASPFWFPDSVLLAALLINRPRDWWFFLLAPLPIRLFAEVSHEVSLWFLLTTFGLDAVKGVLTAVLLRHFIPNPARLKNVREYGIFCFFAVLLVPSLAAFGGAFARFHLGYDFWLAWEQWFLSNALTQLVVTPVILYWVLARPWKLPRLSWKRAVEATVLAVGLVVTSFLAFNVSPDSIRFAEPRFYAPVPFLFWAAIRFGMFGACGSIAIITVFAVRAALREEGLFGGQPPAEVALSLQNFLLLRAAPLYLVAVLVKQRREVERTLRESEERMQFAVQNVGLGFWIWNPETRYLWTSERLGELLGFMPGESVTMESFLTHVLPEDRPNAEAALERSHAGLESMDVEYRVRLPDGTIRWVSVRARHQQDDERISGMVMDISDRMRALNEADERRDELAHLSRVASLNVLSGSLAHELNQPLAIILSNAQAAQHLLQREQPDVAELREILADIVSEDRRAGDVIKRLRVMVRRGETAYQAVDVNETVEEVLKLTHGDLVERGIAVSCKFEAGLPSVTADRVQLQQVLLNLVTNACDAMRANPPGERILTLVTSVQEGEVRIDVLDSGSGLPDDIEGMFKPFHTTKDHGLGLGLAISRALVTAHGGRLWAAHNVDRGAAFHVTLTSTEKTA